MAEVLVTLAVIGVVAALTLPTLIQTRQTNEQIQNPEIQQVNKDDLRTCRCICD